MNAVVVFESLWGNTAAVARAIADGIGPGTRVLSTSEATPQVVADAGLLVAGCPVIAFGVPTQQRLEGVRTEVGRAPSDPDLTQPPMHQWLDGLAQGTGRCAAFDTRVRGPFGSASPKVLRATERLGYRSVVKPEALHVSGKYGPLRDGELDRARRWGQDLGRQSA
ncbi:MAG: flavodoxin family protein [Candidatus Dormibacteria bacterium]